MKLDRLTQKSQEALQEAQERATSAGHPEITPEHVLLALLEQADGIVPSLLGKAGVDVERLAGLVSHELERAPRVTGGGEPFLSRRVKKASRLQTFGMVLFLPFWNSLTWLRISRGVLFSGVAETKITRLPRQI